MRNLTNLAHEWTSQRRRAPDFYHFWLCWSRNVDRTLGNWRQGWFRDSRSLLFPRMSLFILQSTTRVTTCTPLFEGSRRFDVSPVYIASELFPTTLTDLGFLGYLLPIFHLSLGICTFSPTGLTKKKNSTRLTPLPTKFFRAKPTDSLLFLSNLGKPLRLLLTTKRIRACTSIITMPTPLKTTLPLSISLNQWFLTLWMPTESLSRR